MPLRDCYLPRSFVCGGRGVSARGWLRFFWRGFFSVPSFASLRFGLGFAFVCFCFCFVLFFFFVCLCCARAWVWRPFACGCGAYACLGHCVLVCGLGRVAGVRQGLEITWFVVVAGDDVVDVCCAHVTCRVVPPVAPPYYLPASGRRGDCRVEALAFVFCFCENLFPGFVPVCWQALTAVGCGPWHVCRVPSGAWVVGWQEGGEGFGSEVRFLVGVGFWGWGVWWVEVFSWRVPVPGWRVARRVGGAVPLRPLLKSCPHLLGVLWFPVRVVPPLGGGVCWLVGACGVRFFPGGGGLSLWVACLAGCVLVGLFSTWSRGCCSRWSLRFGRAFVGGVPRLLALWVVFLSGGCSQARCVAPVGRADLDGRALRRPPLPPPTLHDGGSHTPESGGRTHTLKR